jgi:hypothetical protein
MRRRALLLSAALFGALAFSLDPSSGAQRASRIIDRTVLCEAGITGGVRKIDLHASSAARGGRSAYVEARTSVTPTWRLVGLGRELDGRGSMELSPDCRRLRARVPLNSRGLAGGLASNIGDAHDCWTPRWLVIRARAVFRSPTALRPSRPWGFPTLFARGNVTAAYLAILTRAGKRIAFAAMNESGKAHVFMSDRCFPD